MASASAFGSTFGVVCESSEGATGFQSAAVAKRESRSNPGKSTKVRWFKSILMVGGETLLYHASRKTRILAD
jgi:hypothetical protein